MVFLFSVFNTLRSLVRQLYRARKLLGYLQLLKYLLLVAIFGLAMSPPPFYEWCSLYYNYNNIMLRVCTLIFLLLTVSCTENCCHQEDAHWTSSWVQWTQRTSPVGSPKGRIPCFECNGLFSHKQY